MTSYPCRLSRRTLVGHVHETVLALLQNDRSFQHMVFRNRLVRVLWKVPSPRLLSIMTGTIDSIPN